MHSLPQNNDNRVNPHALPGRTPEVGLEDLCKLVRRPRPYDWRLVTGAVSVRGVASNGRLLRVVRVGGFGVLRLRLRQLDGVAAGGGAQPKVNLVTPLALSAHCLLQFSSNHSELTAAPKPPNKHI
ncbi:hypothetical protein EYF80_027559 [Liparis tanakae]|uniref:Uncharacterized protein n=1 Tax=Liparis tanakae TaxID=230148 RepID=A0A4Z2H8N2_9TELE|nr:hypothetical protein EYF80_027559 [Liparis tanakae]